MQTGGGHAVNHASGHKNNHHANGPKGDHPWEVMIDVYLNSVAPDGTPDFDIQTCLPTDWPSTDQNPIVNFYNDGRNGFSIEFRFFDNTGSAKPYIFVKDPKDALWSQKGSVCPTKRVCDIFTDTSRVDDTTLSTKNVNDDACSFQYALRVTSDGKSVVILDPGGNNMNGRYIGQ
jgi:hypothetical protein